MLSKLRTHRPSHGVVVAYLALFVALGGSSYAAIKVTGKNVPKDALTGADIKNLTGADVTNNSLDSRDVRNLLASDFQAGQLPVGPQGPKGDKGDKGEKGAQGDQGDQGPSGVSDFHLVFASDTVPANGSKDITKACPAGEQVTGGGGANSYDPTMYLAQSAVFGDGWTVTYKNTTAVAKTGYVHAVCASP